MVDRGAGPDQAEEAGQGQVVPHTGTGSWGSPMPALCQPSASPVPGPCASPLPREHRILLQSHLVTGMHVLVYNVVYSLARD